MEGFILRFQECGFPGCSINVMHFPATDPLPRLRPAVGSFSGSTSPAARFPQRGVKGPRVPRVPRVQRGIGADGCPGEDAGRPRPAPPRPRRALIKASAGAQRGSSVPLTFQPGAHHGAHPRDDGPGRAVSARIDSTLPIMDRKKFHLHGEILSFQKSGVRNP